MKETENKKPNYCGEEDSPIIGCVNQPETGSKYRIRDLDKYCKKEEAKGRTFADIKASGELEQFRIKWKFNINQTQFFKELKGV